MVAYVGEHLAEADSEDRWRSNAMIQVRTMDSRVSHGSKLSTKSSSFSVPGLGPSPSLHETRAINATLSDAHEALRIFQAQLASAEAAKLEVEAERDMHVAAACEREHLRM